MLREVGSFVLRSGLVIGVAELVTLQWARAAWAETDPVLRAVLVLLGITALLWALNDGEEKPLLGDRRFRLLAVAAFPVFLLVMYWGPSAKFFRLAALRPAEWGMVGV